MLAFAMRLAVELGKTLGELKRMPTSEFFLWQAYFAMKPDDFVPVEDKLRKVFGKRSDE